MSRRTKGQDENFATPFGNQLIGLAFAFAVLFVVSGMLFPVRFRIVWVSFWNAVSITLGWFLTGWRGPIVVGTALLVAAIFAVLAAFFAVKDLYIWTRSFLTS